MQYTYVLLSERDGREHRAGRVRSTAYRRPVQVIDYEVCLAPPDARRRERFLKTGKGKRSLTNRLKASLEAMRSKLEGH